MFFKYRVPVIVTNRTTGKLEFDFLWVGNAKGKAHAEAQALTAAFIAGRSIRYRQTIAPAGAQRVLTGVSKVLVGLTVAAAALFGASQARADTGVIAQLQTKGGKVQLQGAQCVFGGETFPNLYQANFVFDSGRTEFGCYYADRRTAEIVVRWHADASTFTYPAAAFNLVK